MDSKSKYFRDSIRRLNAMFCLTSMGGKVDSSINRGKGPVIFRISGQNYHAMGSLLPAETAIKPIFAQLYIYDTKNEVSNRQTNLSKSTSSSTSKSSSLERQLIEELKFMLDSDNELVKVYRMARDFFQEEPNAKLKLRLLGKRQQDGRTYNLPTTSEVTALIVGDIDNAFDKRDIIVETKSGMLQRISELHLAYLPLHYPLLFPMEMMDTGLIYFIGVLLHQQKIKETVAQ